MLPYLPSVASGGVFLYKKEPVIDGELLIDSGF